MKATTQHFEKTLRVAISALLALSLCTWMLPANAYEAYALSSNDSGVLSWNGVKQGDNYVFTLEANGSAANAGGKTFTVAYGDGTQGNNGAFQTTWDCSEVKSGWYQNIEGATIASSGTTVTITIPSTYFANEDFTVSFGGSSITSAEMSSGSSAVEPDPEPTPEPDNGATGDSSSTGDSDNGGTTGGTESGDSGVESGSGSDNSSDNNAGNEPTGTYTGIVIDGDFSDWDAVKKYDIVDVDQNGNPKGWDTVNKMAMVWDGDWVYLYFESNSDDPGAMTGAGPWSDGQFSIKTDLGNETLVRFGRGDQGPVVLHPSGSTVACNNFVWANTPHKWEAAVPASSLGYYKETINFGMYQVAPTITDVADLQGSKGGDFETITYDGKYGDWNYYPHSTLQYATGGTNESVVDGRAALYADSAQQKLFGHVSTTMLAHLNERGGEFTSAVSIRVNGDSDLMLTPQFAAVDADGNINWSPQLSGLENGTYEFYLFSTTCRKDSHNVNDSGVVCYGKATITITDDQQDMEWYMDIPTLAANLHGNWGQNADATSIDPNDIHLFEANYGKIGDQWVTTAGTSTAPFVGIGLCVAAVGAVYGWRRYKRRAAEPAAAAAVKGL